MTLHVVTLGETLSSISSIYGLTAEYLQKINSLPNPNNLVVGQSIVILFPQTTHTVAENETLYSIGKRYAVTVIQLLRNNPHLTQTPLQTGEEIIIAFEREPLGTIETNGYVYPNVDMVYLGSLLPYLTYISVFTSGINSDGTIIKVNDSEIIAAAKTYGVAPLMHISTLDEEGSFNSELGAKVLSDTALQGILIRNILQTLSEKGYYGLDIDFEFIPGQYKDAYVNFISTLTDVLNESGYIVIAALAPKIRADQPGLLYEAHDYGGIGNAANFAFLMTYEWGYTYGPPMAVAPINSVKAVLNYAITEIPPEKIFIGVPLYGYLWNLPYEQGISKATSLSNFAATEIAAQKNAEILYDEKAESPYFFFTDNYGRESVIWFEDARSIDAKLRLVKDYGLHGAGYWNIDRPFPQSWMVLNALYNILQVDVVFL